MYLISLRGIWGSVLSVLLVVLFSFSLFLSENMVFFWLFLELIGLSLIPSFFYLYGGVSFVTLFIYIVVSSVSSVLMLFGVLDSNLMFFFVLGFLVKFGVFPFMGWVYCVILGSNYVVVWLFSTFLKFPFVYICFFLSGLGDFSYSAVFLFCLVTFLFLSVWFWVSSYSWRCCWCHMMISSSVALVLMSVKGSMDLLFWFFLAYFFWSSLTIFYLYQIDSFGFSLNNSSLASLRCPGLLYWFGFIFFLLTTPISFALLYKVVMVFCVYALEFYTIFFWVVYSLSEQFFFFKYAASSYISKLSFSWFFLV
uniref:NADH dehydrogenase subunit 2 n=1 Tax=Posthodiplostomum centrarchi TaxID=1954244 RepID=A0A6J3YMG8_9TREM|nr:NADH dehydrogenase subunit 2 [Posthodiplostomum centrarchi]